MRSEPGSFRAMSLRFSHASPLALALVLATACSQQSDPAVQVQVNELVPLPDNAAFFQPIRYDLTDEGTCLRYGLTSRSRFDEQDGLLTEERFDHGSPFRLDILIMSQSGDGSGNYVEPLGWVTSGAVEIGAGERRVIPATVYPGTRATIGLDELSGRFLHTATALDDGRVLVTGGFGVVEELPACVGDTLGTYDRCFHLGALSDAWVWIPARGEFQELPAMAHARGGHTATLLPNGQVLVVGGASSATMGIAENADGTRRFTLALDEATDASALSYVVFDPEQDETTLAQGGSPHAGSWGEERSLQRPRFMHATAFADRTTYAEGETVIAGGVSNASTFEVVEVFGSDSMLGDLLVPRQYPSAVTLETAAGRETWIVGGVLEPAEDAGNDNLVETWVTGATTTVGGASIGFPTSSLGLAAPAYNHLRPAIAQLDTDTALVEGFYGARCFDATAGVDSTSYEWADSSGTRLCEPSERYANGSTSYVISLGDGQLGLAVDEPSAGRGAFGAVAELPFGVSVITGGVADAALTPSNRVQLVMYAPGTADKIDFEETLGQLSDEERGERYIIETDPLVVPRLFHRSTAIAGAGVLTTGGISIDDDERIELVTAHEVGMLPQVALHACHLHANGDTIPSVDGGTSTLDAGVDAGIADAGVDAGDVSDAATDGAVSDAGADAGG